MVEVNGVTMIEKTLGHLEKLGLKRIVFVIGYEGQKLKSYVESLNIKTPLEFIDNDVYYKTNNIYSLYLAKEKEAEKKSENGFKEIKESVTDKEDKTINVEKLERENEHCGQGGWSYPAV